MTTTEPDELSVEDKRKRDAMLLAKLIYDIFTRLKTEGKLQ